MFCMKFRIRSRSFAKQFHKILDNLNIYLLSELEPEVGPLSSLKSIVILRNFAPQYFLYEISYMFTKFLKTISRKTG